MEIGRDEAGRLLRPEKAGLAMTSEVKGEVSYPSISQFRTSLITSVRLSIVTKSASTSGCL